MNISNYIKLIIIVIFLVGFYFYFEYLSDREQKRYYEVYKMEFAGKVTYSETYRAFIILSINNLEGVYYLVPKACETDSIILDERPVVGDSIFKESSSDTLYVYSTNGDRIICLYPPWEL